MSPIEYIEHRLKELRAERPLTEAGQHALVVVIEELETIRDAFRAEALAACYVAWREAHREGTIQ